MALTLELDPSRPCQVGGDLLALWLPRGRGRDALAEGLSATIDVCANPACLCTIARLQVAPIDDRATRVVRDGDHVRTTWRSQPSKPPWPEGSVRLKLDILTGVVEADGGGELPAVAARFFEEPLPYWVLDHIWDRWRAPRLATGIDLRSQALDHWAPGELLSTMIALPEERHDRYVVDGDVYQVDLLFPVDPDDPPCTEAMLSVFAVREDGRSLVEVGTAVLPFATMFPADFRSDGLSTNNLARLYLEWRRRNVPAEARILELRDLTRQRGLELHRLAAARSRAAVPVSRRVAPGSRPAALVSPPAAPGSRPGRNTPCPCGSGKKYKRCCGK